MGNIHNVACKEGINLNSQFYKGSISKYELNDIVKIYEFSFKSKEPFTFDFNVSNYFPIYICVNLESKNNVAMGLNNLNCSVKPYASMVMPVKTNDEVAINFEKDKNYDFTLIQIDKSKLEISQPNLLEFLNTKLNTIGSGNFLKLNKSIPNLIMCDYVQKLRKLDKNSFENKLIAAGYCNIILGLKFKEIYSQNETDSHLSIFRDYEIRQLKFITESIRNNPEKQYCINEICKQTGLSVSKLQSGFKDMHKCTVAIFIRNVRLEKALELLRNTDLNISEIVYSVGLNSRSYFCRIFKKKFKCAPKYYQQRLREAALEAS